ncbi:MAG: response regulator [Lachnospiraceae bacterium]|nr:response regulator [Eubacterium sp.]MBQ1734288.1 response regulator [Lachnospiraceae bacterium]
MKKALVIIPNLVIIGLVLYFIVSYANFMEEESRQNVIEAYEKMTLTVDQIIANYLEDEQHLCDIWSNYINRSAEAGTPMTAKEAMSYIRKAKISPEISGHLIFMDDPELSGISTTEKTGDTGDYSVSYKNVPIFGNLESVSNVDGVVNITRAYTNPMNGIQSIAFMNYVQVLDEDTGKMRTGLLMRVVPISRLKQKLVFLKGEYENVEISIIDQDGDYIVRGKSLKNSNFFQYFRSYNDVSIEEYERIKSEIIGGVGSMTIYNSKGEECVISYTPFESLKVWYLIAYIPKDELMESHVVDWFLLGNVSVALVLLLIYNFITLMFYNRKLSEAAVQANQANEAKSYFLSTMSHDIRTPMNAILGLNEMVLRESDDEKILGYSENIRTAGNTLLGIINDILDFSKIEAGKMDIINGDYRFVSMLNDLVNMVQKKTEDKGLTFKLDIDSGIPSILNGDEIRIKQVITNILSNAVKYTKEGSVTFSVGYEKIPDKQDAVILKVSVADTGIGIKPEDISRMFKAFERVEEKKNRNIEGTGLGMTIAQSFLVKMGSHLQVESVYGEGSVFYFNLEQKVVKWNPIGDYEDAFRQTLKERKGYREKFTAPTAKVLVVDDAPVNLTVFLGLLSSTKIQIDTAENGDEAIGLFKKKQYDVIFLDHMMPEKDGIEVLGEMRGLKDTPNYETPIICLTANAISGMSEMYIEAGFDDYMTKPIDPDRLEGMLLLYLPKEKIIPASDEKLETNNVDIFAKVGNTGNTCGIDGMLPDFIRNIKAIDVKTGIKHCGSDKAYLITLKKFLDTAEKNADEIEAFWTAKDIKNTTIKVHALKSTSRIIGALELGDFAAKLEKAGDSDDIIILEEELPELISQYRKLAKELEPLNNQEKTEGDDERPVISNEELNETYRKLLEYCANFDFDSVVCVAQTLEKYQIPKEETERVEAILKAVDDFDYDKIPGVINREE